MKRLLLALFIVALLILPGQVSADLLRFGGFLPCTSDNGTLCTTPRYISTPGITVSGLTASLPVFTDASKGLVSVTAANAFTAIKQAATESATGVAELATVTEAVAGTDTSRIVTPQGNAAATAILKNPLAFAQGIDLTASATVGGLSIADDADLGFGTSPFFLEGTVSLADYTPSAVVYIIYKVQDATHRYIFNVTTDGYLSLDLNGTIYKSSATLASVGVTDNYPAKFRADVTPGTTNTTVDFSVNGIALGTQQTAVNPGSATNTGTLYIMGTSTTRYAGTVYSIHAGNRAFTAAEFLAEYKKGIADADKWGSQTAIRTDTMGADGTANWTASDCALTFDTDHYVFDPSGVQPSIHYETKVTTVIGKKYRVSIDVKNGTGTATDLKLGRDSTGANSYGDIFATTADWVTQTYIFTATETTHSGGVYGTINFTGNIELKNFSITQVGATLALENEGIQRDGWKDSSTNGLNASYPASGYSFLRPIRTDSAEGLLSVTNVSLAADADTTIYTVPVGKRLVLTKAILVVGADAGTSVISIGADGAETDWLPNNTLSALDAANDAAILVPVPNTTPVLVKSYAGGTVIQAKVSSHAGGATNYVHLFGYLY
jgi:hypothetical protein